MDKIRNYIKKIEKLGFGYTISNTIRYRVDDILFYIMKLIFFYTPLTNTIVIESHNDFDSNGGAFYNYLIEHGLNKKYKIVWLLKHPEIKYSNLPYNVVCAPLYKTSIKRNYYINRAKIFTADNTVVRKARKNQIFFYFDHGAFGLKNCKGVLNIPKHVDYVLMESHEFAKIQSDQYSMEYPSNRILYLGHPIYDVINRYYPDEIKKVSTDTFSKVIIWMPTFRKGGGYLRNDSNKELPLGIPLIYNWMMYVELNEFLKENNVLLIIKIHPMQDLKDLKIESLSNIKVLTGMDVKEKKIDNYRLLGCVDAMISDYSGIAYDFLQLNRPIAYILDDIKEYNRGFIVENIDSIIAGKKIFTFDDMIDFISSIITGEDPYKEKREDVRNYFYEHIGGNNCKKLVEFMKLDEYES